MSQHDNLKEAVESFHGGEAAHREAVPVKETWQGKTIWDGIVEVFISKDIGKQIASMRGCTIPENLGQILSM